MFSCESDYHIYKPVGFYDKDICVIGNVKNFSTAVYGKVSKHLNLNVVTVDEMTRQPIGAIVWMNGIAGDGWGWSFQKVIDDLARLKSLYPSVKILGSVFFKDDKEIVQRIFKNSFGYDLEVDPLFHNGLAVKKSRVQARHDGNIVQCPLLLNDVDVDSVYQKVVNNIVDKYVLDVRVPVINGIIPFCYLKYRPIADRFSNVNTFVKLVMPHDVFSESEVFKIKEFCERSGLEIGEVDVLRCKDNGKIYIVDSNNTPSGPPNKITDVEGDLAIRMLSSELMKFYSEI